MFISLALPVVKWRCHPRNLMLAWRTGEEAELV